MIWDKKALTWAGLIVVTIMILAYSVGSKAAFTSEDVQSVFGQQQLQSSFQDMLRSDLTLLEEGCFNGVADWGCQGYDAVGLVESKYDAVNDICTRKVTEQHVCGVGKYCVSSTVNALNTNHDGLKTWQCTGTSKDAEVPESPVEFKAPFVQETLTLDLSKSEPVPGSQYFNEDGSLTSAGEALYGKGQNIVPFTTTFDGLSVNEQVGRMVAFGRGDMAGASEETLMNGICSTDFGADNACPDGDACVSFRELIATGDLEIGKVDRFIVFVLDHFSSFATVGAGAACPFTAGTTCTIAVAGAVGSELLPTDALIQKLANWNILSSYYSYDLDSAGLCTKGARLRFGSADDVRSPPLGENPLPGTDPKTFTPLGSDELINCDVDAIAASVCPVNAETNTCPRGSRCVSMGALEAAREMPQGCSGDISEHYQNWWAEQGIRLTGCAVAAGTIGAKAVKGVQAIGLGGKRTTLAQNMNGLKKLKWGGNKRLVKGRAATALAATATVASWFKSYTPAILASGACVAGGVGANYVHNVVTDNREEVGLCLSESEAKSVEAAALANDPSREGVVANAVKEVLNEIYNGAKNLIRNPLTAKIILYVFIGLMAYILLKFIWRKI